MIALDGSTGEGGGQILRSALALSVVTGRPFRVTGIRARRQKPGLLRQHLTAVRAAAAIGKAEVEGDALLSTSLLFRPRAIVGGEHHFAIGSAGSAMLVLQTVLPPLLVAPGPSRVVVEGGTHNSSSPPFEFLDRVFVPLLRRMGADVRLTLERPGFYPAGGGKVVMEVTPSRLTPIEILERGEIRRTSARAIVSGIPASVGHRELNVLRERFGLGREDLSCEEVPDPRGPGNVVLLEIVAAELTELFVGFGEKRVPGEAVAAGVADEAQRWLERDVPVGPHLADQLLVPFAMAGGGRFLTSAPTLHATTNIGVIRRFLDVPMDLAERADGRVEVRVG